MFLGSGDMQEADSPNITRAWSQIQDKTRKYLCHDGMRLMREESLLKAEGGGEDLGNRRGCVGTITYSMGEFNPSTFPRSCVNLDMKENTNRDSQRSLG